MKKFSSFIIIVAASISMGFAQEAKKAEAKNTWTFAITPNTKKAAIDSVIAAWRKNSIDFRIAKLNYDATGKLTQIVGNIDIKANGSHASATFKSQDLKAFKIVVDDSPAVSVAGK